VAVAADAVGPAEDEDEGVGVAGDGGGVLAAPGSGPGEEATVPASSLR
jgi:hypothetical protein